MTERLLPDPRQRQRCYARIADAFDQQDFFCAEVRDRLLERLELVRLEPHWVVDLGGGTGQATSALQARFPQAGIINLDRSMAMLAAGGRGTAVCAEAARLPLQDASVDLVFSSLMLPDAVDAPAVFAEVRRVLRTPGLFLFTTLGPDTLRELRDAWARADPAGTAHVQVFADMHNIGDALVQAGFAEPVMDTERLTVRYADTTRLAHDLRAAGAGNVLTGRRRGLTPPHQWRQLGAGLLQGATSDGRFGITAELVTGQAWTGEPARGVGADEDGTAYFPVSRLRR